MEIDKYPTNADCHIEGLLSHLSALADIVMLSGKRIYTSQRDISLDMSVTDHSNEAIVSLLHTLSSAPTPHQPSHTPFPYTTFHYLSKTSSTSPRLPFSFFRNRQHNKRHFFIPLSILPPLHRQRPDHLHSFLH